MAKKTLQDGIALFKKGDLDAATKIFQARLDQDPRDAAAHLWMGNCHVLDNSLDLARTSFQHVLASQDAALRAEALHQLRSISFNQLLHRLLLEPPLRYLLIGALFFYGMSYFLFKIRGLEQVAWWGQVLAVGVLLPLFFVWSLFIITYFVSNMAFHPTKRSLGVHIARFLVALGLLAFLTSAFFAYTQKTYLWIGLASFLGFFSLSLLISRVLQWTGQRLLGEVSPLLLHSLFNFDPPALQEIPIPSESNKSHRR